VDVPGGSVDVPGDGVDAPGGSVDIPGDGVDAPGDSVDVPGGSVDAPGASVDIPGDSVDIPGGAVEVFKGGVAVHCHRCRVCASSVGRAEVRTAERRGGQGADCVLKLCHCRNSLGLDAWVGIILRRRRRPWPKKIARPQRNSPLLAT
jgi:hypothetical protein